MDRKEWEKIGNSVRDIVESAVNSRDFQKLNQTISNIVGAAADNIAAGVKRQTACTEEERERKQAAARKAMERAKLFVNDNAVWNSGLGMVIPGGILAGFAGTALFILVVLWLIGGIMNIGIQIAAVILTAFMCAMLGLVSGGRKKMKGIKRFRKYQQHLSETYYCNIEDLAAYTGQSVSFTRKDVMRMTKKGWFKEGHLDAEKKCFIVSNNVYQEYLELKRQRQMLEANQFEIQKQNETCPKEEQQGMQSAVKDDSEAAQVIRTGQEYIREIRHWNDLIPGEEISRKISRMELLVKRIFERVEQHPEQIEDIRKLLKYYLPTTVKLLKAYDELDRQPVDTETILGSKQEIENTLDTLNTAFEKMLDGLFQDTAWDVASDISVLHTMLAQEGLTKDDF